MSSTVRRAGTTAVTARAPSLFTYFSTFHLLFHFPLFTFHFSVTKWRTQQPLRHRPATCRPVDPFAIAADHRRRTSWHVVEHLDRLARSRNPAYRHAARQVDRSVPR